MDANTQKIEAKRAKYREYYYNHHEHIINYRKESGVAQKSYQKYYGEKAEIIRAKNLARYHAKKAERLALERPPATEDVKVEESPAS